MPAISAIRSAAFALAGFLFGLLLAALAVPLSAYAAPPPPVDNDAKTVSVVVYGNDPCPAGKDDEIVVCARQPESERYRIPKRFRGKKDQPAPNTSWTSKNASTEEASRQAAGLPDTCSAVGTGGQSGCYHQFQVQSMQQRQLQRDEKQADAPAGGPQN